MDGPSLSVVVVAHDSLADLRRTLPPLMAELRADDEVVVVDNASGDGLAAELGTFAPSARLIPAGANVGFAAGANLGVAAARGDLVVLLNPDALVASGFAAAIRSAWRGPAGAWMGLVTLDDGSKINTSGGVLHFAGFGWAGQVGESIAEAPRTVSEVGFLSGACLAIPRTMWDEIGGFAEHFFMYCEDVDLSLRLRLRGHVLAIVPSARVVHDYEFAKGGYKWRMLERNRWATILRTYPRELLLAVLPALLITEVAVWVVAARGGWLRMKALATFDLMRWLPRLRHERSVIQATAQVSARTFAEHLVATLDSPYFGAVGRHPVLQRALALYWQTALSLVRV